jgi:hypothetical protein
MAEAPLRLVVVGHVNAGKTTLLRTLARQAGFGAVGTQPGTTTRVDQAVSAPGEIPAVAWLDTPGFDDPVMLADRLSRLPQPAPGERLKALLQQPEVVSEHAGEWRALGAARDGDAIVLVIDSVELVLPKHRGTIELLQACGRPIVVLLNRPGHARSRAGAWADALAGHGLGEVLALDAASPGPQAELGLMRALAGVLAPRRPDAAGLEAAWVARQRQRELAGLGLIADAVVGLAARRETLARATVNDPEQKAQAIARFRENVAQHADGAQRALIAAHGFPPGGPTLRTLDGVEGRWQDDLFNAEVLKDAGGKLAGGAALGAAIGLGADVALAGLSLGAGAAVGAAVGATVGSIASQGFAPTGRKLLNRVTGQLDLTVEDAVLVVLADRLMAMQEALQARGHGAAGPWAWPNGTVFDAAAADALVAAASAARGHPEWATACPRSAGDDLARRKLVDRVAAQLAALPPRRPPHSTALPAPKPD